MSLAAGRIFTALALAGALASWTPALAQAPNCRDLARQIAQMERRPDRSAAQKYERAAEKQRSEIERTQNYGEQSGCWRQSFYEPTSPMCRQLDARLAQMRANLEELQFRADQAAAEIGGAANREALLYDYETYCSGRDKRRDASMPRNPLPLDVVPPDEPSPDDGGLAPDIAPSGATIRPDLDVRPPPDQADLGDKAVCVRLCDGGYFPLTAPVRANRTQDLQALCSAQCPNTEAKLFTMKKGEDISNAVSADGDFYTALPNAFKFRKKFDPACACKPAGKNWGQVLTEAEKLLERETGKQDAQVSPQQAEQMSQPEDPPALRRDTPKPPAAAPKPAAPAAAAPTPSPKPAAPAAAAGGATSAPPSAPAGPGEYREVIGPDGVKRRVRIVGPKL
jgi:hypothetical protein